MANNAKLRGHVFQSTLPVRGATMYLRKSRKDFEAISIHAPRAGSDRGDGAGVPLVNNFNPRSPCGERLYLACLTSVCVVHFNPRSPCGERQTLYQYIVFRCFISIHAPRAGSDTFNIGLRLKAAPFQSTLPVRGATGLGGRWRRLAPISIHAPRAGSDINVESFGKQIEHFNPRSPCGERR